MRPLDGAGKTQIDLTEDHCHTSMLNEKLLDLLLRQRHMSFAAVTFIRGLRTDHAVVL